MYHLFPIPATKSAIRKTEFELEKVFNESRNLIMLCLRLSNHNFFSQLLLSFSLTFNRDQIFFIFNQDKGHSIYTSIFSH